MPLHNISILPTLGLCHVHAPLAQGGEQPLRCTWVYVQLQQNVIILLVYALPSLGIVMALAVCFYLFVPQARII